ncbi:hypothetical protein PR048_019370 [Dryococelus australis]|uniref:Uncharacterized protein n=1 Tax=Dryococelus australis TaxID=614101 RepID=A0ABQ9H3E3_9NEOP|nr:hypothetical protein PR048_019370 [Dryococelus australis]
MGATNIVGSLSLSSLVRTSSQRDACIPSTDSPGHARAHTPITPPPGTPSLTGDPAVAAQLSPRLTSVASTPPPDLASSSTLASGLREYFRSSENVSSVLTCQMPLRCDGMSTFIAAQPYVGGTSGSERIRIFPRKKALSDFEVRHTPDANHASKKAYLWPEVRSDKAALCCHRRQQERQADVSARPAFYVLVYTVHDHEAATIITNWLLPVPILKSDFPYGQNARWHERAVCAKSPFRATKHRSHAVFTRRYIERTYKDLHWEAWWWPAMVLHCSVQSPSRSSTNGEAWWKPAVVLDTFSAKCKYSLPRNSVIDFFEWVRSGTSSAIDLFEWVTYSSAAINDFVEDSLLLLNTSNFWEPAHPATLMGTTYADDYDDTVNANDGMIKSACVECALTRCAHENDKLQNKRSSVLNTDKHTTATKKSKLYINDETGSEDDNENRIYDDYDDSVGSEDNSLDVLTHFTNEFPSKSDVNKGEDAENTDYMFTVDPNELHFGIFGVKDQRPWVLSPALLTRSHKSRSSESSSSVFTGGGARGYAFLSRFVIDEESKVGSMERKHPKSPRRKTFKRKMIATISWELRGVLLVDVTERNATVNASQECYETTPSSCTSGIAIYCQASSRPYWSSNDWTRGINHVFSREPYCPDFAPLDFHLFGKMKKHLWQTIFQPRRSDSSKRPPSTVALVYHALSSVHTTHKPFSRHPSSSPMFLPQRLTTFRLRGYLVSSVLAQKLLQIPRCAEKKDYQKILHPLSRRLPQQGGGDVTPARSAVKHCPGRRANRRQAVTGSAKGGREGRDAHTLPPPPKKKHCPGPSITRRKTAQSQRKTAQSQGLKTLCLPSTLWCDRIINVQSKTYADSSDDTCTSGSYANSRLSMPPVLSVTRINTNSETVHGNGMEEIGNVK